jgi:hypothetical protein
MTGDRILLASRSEGKLRELRPLFAAAGLVVEDLGDVDVRPVLERADELAEERRRGVGPAPATAGIAQLRVSALHRLEELGPVGHSP